MNALTPQTAPSDPSNPTSRVQPPQNIPNPAPTLPGIAIHVPGKLPNFKPLAPPKFQQTKTATHHQVPMQRSQRNPEAVIKKAAKPQFKKKVTIGKPLNPAPTVCNTCNKCGECGIDIVIWVINSVLTIISKHPIIPEWKGKESKAHNRRTTSIPESKRRS